MTEPLPIDEKLSDESIVDQFLSRREERLTKAWQAYAPRNPIASDLHDCRRYQIMRLMAWEVRRVPDLRGMQVIEQGRVMEPTMIRQMQDEGWEIVETQAHFHIDQSVTPGGPRKRVLSGKIDGKIRVGPRELIPFDTKDTSEYVLARIDTEADLLASPWTRKWWRQMQSYMLGENLERSLLILSHRGDRKPIVLHLDYEGAEKILQLCAWAVRVTDELIGDGISYDKLDEALEQREIPYHEEFSTCRVCPFRDLACFPPDLARSAAQLRPDLAEDIARYSEIKPLKSEAEKLHKRIKAETEGSPITVAGDFVVEGEMKTRRYKAKAAYESESWSFDVRRIGDREGEEEEGA